MKGSFNTAGLCQLEQNHLCFCMAERTPPAPQTHRHTQTHTSGRGFPPASPRPGSMCLSHIGWGSCAERRCWPHNGGADRGVSAGDMLCGEGAEKWKWGGMCEVQRSGSSLGSHYGSVQPRRPWGWCAQSLGSCASNALAESCSCSQGDSSTLLDGCPCKRIPEAGARNVSWAEARQQDLGDVGRVTLGKAPLLLCLSLHVVQMIIFLSPAGSQLLRMQTFSGRHCCFHSSLIPLASKISLILDGISKRSVGGVHWEMKSPLPQHLYGSGTLWGSMDFSLHTDFEKGLHKILFK